MDRRDAGQSEEKTGDVSSEASHQSPQKKVGNGGAPQALLEGVLTRGLATPLAAGGEDFVITSETHVLGELELGSVVAVISERWPTGEQVAVKVVVKRTPSEEDGDF